MNEQNEPKDGKHLPFDDGLPTKPDVDLLLATWPPQKIAAGDVFEYESVAALLRLPPMSTRFRTVTNNWRNRLLRDFSVVVGRMPGLKFYVLSTDQISAASYPELQSIGRKAQRHRKRLAVAKIETELQRATIEHQARLFLHVERDVNKARKNLIPSTAAPEQPRIAPPKSAAQ